MVMKNIHALEMIQVQHLLKYCSLFMVHSSARLGEVEARAFKLSDRR